MPGGSICPQFTDTLGQTLLSQPVREWRTPGVCANTPEQKVQDTGGRLAITFCSPTGAATGTTAATTRQRRKAAAPRCGRTGGRVSRTPCAAVRKCWLALGLLRSLLHRHWAGQRASWASEVGLCMLSWFQSCFGRRLFSSELSVHTLPGSLNLPEVPSWSWEEGWSPSTARPRQPESSPG